MDNITGIEKLGIDDPNDAPHDPHLPPEFPAFFAPFTGLPVYPTVDEDWTIM